MLFVLVTINFVYNGGGVVASFSTHRVASVMLCIIAPYIVVSTFRQRFSFRLLNKLVVYIAYSTLIFTISVLVYGLVFRSGSRDHGTIVHFTAVCSGYTFVSLPLRGTVLNSSN